MATHPLLLSEDFFYDTEALRALDPLRADALCRVLPAMNAVGDTRPLVAALRALIPSPGEYTSYSPGDSLAAMRDLGIFLGSLKRHGVQPLAAVPELLPVLRALGERTGMAPRDTVHHYCAWNPTGERQRTYTGHVMEIALQDAVRYVFPSLCSALDICAGLAKLEPGDPEYAPTLDQIGELATVMVEAIDDTVARVDPEFFARILRPYFEEIDVGGTDFLGPAAAQVPLWLLDVTLWQSDRPDERYDAFLADSLPYALPPWREFFAAHSGTSSAVSKLRMALSWEEAERIPAPLQASAESLVRVLRTLKTFRARHIRIAREAYREEVRLYEEGSGGAPIALLRAVLDLTRENENLLRMGR